MRSFSLCRQELFSYGSENQEGIRKDLDITWSSPQKKKKKKKKPKKKKKKKHPKNSHQKKKF